MIYTVCKGGGNLYKVVRIYEDTHKKVKVLAAKSGKQMDEVIKLAVDQFEIKSTNLCVMCGKKEALEGAHYCFDCKHSWLDDDPRD